MLTTWDKGDVQGAVDLYFHMDRQPNEAMLRGREVHEKLEKHIKEHKEFPSWFFSYELEDPEPEKEVVVSYNEMFDLKGIFDCLDGTTLYEFKTGNTDALAWARTWQLPIYFLIAEIADITVDRAIILRSNDIEKDSVIVHNSSKKREMARNIIDSVGPEIYSYFEREGLL